MIYLIRHADAVSDEVDPVRPLSAKGRAQVAHVCGILGKGPGFKPREIWHSPLARSLETAQLLAEGLKLAAPVVLKPGLEPDDNPAGIAAALEKESGDVCLVGHEPHLGVLACLLVYGPSRAPMFFHFPKAGVLALWREGPKWRSEWLARAP